MIDGNPVCCTSSSASFSDRASPLLGTSTPISFIASRNSSRSSPDLDGVDLRADQLDAVLRENPLFVQRDGEVERRLPAHRRQHGVRPLVAR